MVGTCLFSSTSVADYQRGLDAYQSGQFDVAMNEWMTVVTSPENTVNPAILAESQYAIAMLYWTGQGVTQDTLESEFWLKEAANLNHSGAQSKLGYLYLSNENFSGKEFEAFRWLHSAAQQGNPDAQYNLAIMYRNGVGTEQDIEKARAWFAAAAAQGDLASAEILSQLDSDSMVGVAGTENPVTHLPTTERAETEELKALPDNTLLDEDWIKSRNPEHFTIQVIALKSAENLENLARKHAEMAPLAIYRVMGSTAELYVLIQGEFSDIEAAKRARDAFPDALQSKENVWIRRFANVQSLIDEYSMKSQGSGLTN
jgi:TPR repeat protein